MGGVLAEKLRRDGHDGHAGDAGGRGLDLDAHDRRAAQGAGTAASARRGDPAASTISSAARTRGDRGTYSHGASDRRAPAATLLLVTSRQPNDALYHALQSDPAALAAAGIRSVTRIGDCLVRRRHRTCGVWRSPLRARSTSRRRAMCPSAANEWFHERSDGIEARRSDSRTPRAPRAAAPRQLPWREIRVPYRPFEILSADQIEAIHLASPQGARRDRHGSAARARRALLKAAGVDVDHASQRARFDRGFIAQAIARAPAEFSAARAQPGPQRHARRQPHRDLLGRRPGLHQRSRSRPARRQLRRHVRFHPPRAVAQHHPSGGRRSRRAARPAGGQPPSRSLPGADHAHRQDLAGLGARQRPRRRRHRDEPHRARPDERGDGAHAGADDDREYQFAAPPGHPDGRRAHGLCRRRPGAWW